MFSILSRRCPLLATSLSVLFCLLSMLISDSRFDLVWFRLSWDHGWIRSGSVNVRKQQQQQHVRSPTRRITSIFCYDLCRELRLFSLRAIWYMYSLVLHVYCSPNIGKYHVSVKHTTVSILHWYFSSLDYIVVFLYWYMIDLPCLAFFLCQSVPNLGCYLARRISQI